jgi:hypothetical protein
MLQRMMEDSHHECMVKWARERGWKIVCSSAPKVDGTSREDYAVRVGGLVVDDPRGGRAGWSLVVRPLAEGEE